MKSKFTLALASVAAVSLFSTQQAQAQTEVSVTEVIETQNLPCKTNYFSTSSDNWFIQLGAGVRTDGTCGDGSFDVTSKIDMVMKKPSLGTFLKLICFVKKRMEWQGEKRSTSRKSIKGAIKEK